MKITQLTTPQRNLAEAFENRKFQAGTIKFSHSTLSDPHIQQILIAVAKAKGVSPDQLIDHIEHKKTKMDDMHKIAPLLYGTMSKNVVESELFNLFWESNVQVNGPEFSGATFYKLIRSIRADHDEFFPLRGFIDKRRLNPKISFVDVPRDDPTQVTTAAATPNGEFIFNVPFMQKLMDFAHLKGVKPKGKKYVSNGGDIPDEYCYLEFLIMHEFMHYSNDDFYYQKIIPNANNTIINWVGDFRTNYLLVKSGYEQLPMGLFNDDINYDRQKTYIDMYNAVLQEFKKLNPEDQNKIQQHMDGQSDDHKPGQQQGKENDVNTQGKDASDIDKNGEAIEKQMEEGKDSSPDERAQSKEESPAQSSGPAGKPGSGGGGGAGVDYSKIMPTFNWQGIVRKFLAAATPRTEETYAKPHRRNVSNLDIAAQTGAAAIRPAEKPLDYADAKLAFCFDSSGSMGSVIGMVYANANKLLRMPAFKNTQALVIKFSSNHQLFKCNFATNKAAKVSSIQAKPAKYDMSTQQIFSSYMAGGTDFSSGLASDLNAATKLKYNVLIFSDSDILYGSNKTNLLNVIKAAPKQVFVIFDRRDTYIKFRQQTGISTPNITYFS